MLGLGYGKYCGTAVGLPTFWLVLILELEKVCADKYTCADYYTIM
jgi:hypothetical protein